MYRTLPLLLLAACGEGTWTLTTWGEDYIEDGIPSSAFEDGCFADFTEFVVVFDERALLDGNGDEAGALSGAEAWDLVPPGPHEMGSIAVPATHYDTVRATIGPNASVVAGNATPAQVDALVTAGASIHVVGAVACGADAVSIDWTFATDTTYACEPEELTIPSGGDDGTELTIHGDHLFYDGLEDADAVLRGQAIVDADGNGDGAVTIAELTATPVAPLGYDVGQYSDVTDLGAFVTFLTRTLGHVDGEGHCQVDL